MKILLTIFTFLTLFTVNAQTTDQLHYYDGTPEPIFSIELNRLIHIQCDAYLTHITRESCITHITDCIWGYMATRNPVFGDDKDRIIHGYLYCSSEL